MKDILEENNRLKSEVQKLISDNMELTAVIRSLRKNAQEEAEHHDRMVGEIEKVYAERDEAREQNAKLRDIAEKAIVPLECDGVPWGAKLRTELDHLKEGAK